MKYEVNIVIVQWLSGVVIFCLITISTLIILLMNITKKIKQKTKKILRLHGKFGAYPPTFTVKRAEKRMLKCNKKA
jgi:hypothetical protein